MKLSHFLLNKISASKAILPPENIFDLPEKVLQFGTGRLLRGLPDYFIDEANRKTNFNGRIVVVKSTSLGDESAFDNQDGLYTLCVRGFQNGKIVRKNIINSSISRVLNANQQWDEILKCAHNAEMQIIISNTTETGIQLVDENIHNDPPESFPGKLLSFLYERFRAFEGKAGTGMIIIPTELIPDNGKTLESIIIELAHLNALDEKFIEWLRNENIFCNSLVDRIVTGMPAEEERKEIESNLEYTDDLLIVSEPYCLWAIEGNQKVRDTLTFSKGVKGMVIEENIDKYRELKLRLLNGTHTLTCGIAFLSNCNTVVDAMNDNLLSGFISELMEKEISPAIPLEISEEEKSGFAHEVRERFRNPYIRHLWKNITLQYSSKMKIRCVPLLINYFEKEKKIPRLITLGFAAYLYYTRPVKQEGKSFYGELNGENYRIDDAAAGWYFEAWKEKSIEAFVKNVLENKTLWDIDLSEISSLENEVVSYLKSIMNNGMEATLKGKL